MKKGGGKIFHSGHPRGPSMEFHNSSDKHLDLTKGSAKGMNPMPTKHHTSPAKEYPDGHAGAKKHK